MKRAGLIELNAVVAVATHKGFRKAALELGVSASALSHAISNLETRLGVRLFNRTTRSVALSEAGERFLARVTPALGQIAEAMDDVNAFRETPSGTLRLNASEGAAQIILAPVVLAFLRRFPDMRVDIVAEGRMVDIVAEGFDAGIRSLEHVPRDMIAISCSPPVRFVVVGSPAYFTNNPPPKTPAELNQHVSIRCRLESGQLYNWEFQKGTDVSAFEPSGQLTLNNDHLMISAALEGAGLAWVHEPAIREHLASGRLIEVLRPWSLEMPGLSLYYPSHRHTPAGMKAFIDMVREFSKTVPYSP